MQQRESTITLTRLLSYLESHKDEPGDYWKPEGCTVDIIDSGYYDRVICNSKIGSARFGLSLEQLRALYNWFDFKIANEDLDGYIVLVKKLISGKRRTLTILPWGRNSAANRVNFH